jgi:hypothetical protein
MQANTIGLLRVAVQKVVRFGLSGALLFASGAALADAALGEKCQLNNKIKCGSGLICSAKKSDGNPIPGSGGVGVCRSTKPGPGDPCIRDLAKCGSGYVCLPHSKQYWGTCKAKN